jgi:hypothetical protein
VLILRLIAALSLTLLPGAWLAFTRLGEGLSLPGRLGLAGAFSPVVVATQFYVLRAAGLSTAAVAWSVVVLNLPAVWLLGRRLTVGAVERGALTQSLFIAGVLFLGMTVPWNFVTDLRVFHSHSWMHTAIVDEFLSGALIPEEPELAGLRLAYPWLPHVYWGTLALLLDWAPTRIFPITNAISLLWAMLLVYEIAKALGARGFASRAAALWIALGTNMAGGAIFFATGWLPGDIRYTPWLRKYAVFNDMPFALAVFAALAALAVLAVRGKGGAHTAVLTAVALASCGVIYPPTFPAAFALAALTPVLLWFRDGGTSRFRGQAMAYAGAAAAGTILSVAALRFITAARTTSAVEISSADAAVSKTASSAIVLAPFLVALCATLGTAIVRRVRTAGFKRLIDDVDPAQVLLAAAALGATGCLVGFRVAGTTYNEYKFMLCAALCLGPFVALAVDRMVSPRLATASVIFSGLLLAPMTLMQNPKFALGRVSGVPAVVERGPYLQLAADSGEAGWTNAIREQTPADTVIVAARSEIFVPAVAARSLYAPIVGIEFPGYWLESGSHMTDLRGYSKRLVHDRLDIVNRLFKGPSDIERETALAEVKSLGRPVAILARTGTDDRLLDWLTRRGDGHRLFEDGSGRVVWLCLAGGGG